MKNIKKAIAVLTCIEAINLNGLENLVVRGFDNCREQGFILYNVLDIKGAYGSIAICSDRHGDGMRIYTNIKRLFPSGYEFINAKSGEDTIYFNDFKYGEIAEKCIDLLHLWDK